MRYRDNLTRSAVTMCTELNDSRIEPTLQISPRLRCAAPYVTGGLSILWTGYFLYTAFRLYGRLQFMREYFGPVYPRELEPTVHAITATLDWRVPLGIAGLPLLVFIVRRAYRVIMSRSCTGLDEHSS